VKKVPDPDPYPAPDHDQAPDPEKAPDPELAPEGPGSSDHFKKVKVPDPAPDPELAPDLEKALTSDQTITVFGWLEQGLGIQFRHNNHKMLLNEKSNILGRFFAVMVKLCEISQHFVAKYREISRN
jgi:hypothetical protein